jgi:hypothetical protein
VYLHRSKMSLEPLNVTTTLSPAEFTIRVPSGRTFVWIDVILFSILGLLAYRQFKKSRSDLRQSGGEAGPVSAAGGETRYIFMGMLAVSNFARALTLCIEMLTQQDKQLQRSVRTWVRDFVMSLPTLFFLTTYSIVILFWAQVYYASVLVSFPLLKPIVVFINIAAYVVFSVIACLTLLLMAWAEFRQYLYFLLGVLFLFCGLNFFYYGVKVAAQLLDRNKQLSRKSHIIRRVVILTSSVPFVLLAKGVYCTAIGLGFISGSPPFGLSRLSWDCTNFFFTEFVPSVLLLCVFWPGSPRADAYEPPSSVISSRQEETVQSLESPLLRQTPVRHPHLEEAQNRLANLSAQAKEGPADIRKIQASRGLSGSVDDSLPPMMDLVSRPWAVRKQSSATQIIGV